MGCDPSLNDYLPNILSFLMKIAVAVTIFLWFRKSKHVAIKMFLISFTTYTVFYLLTLFTDAINANARFDHLFYIYENNREIFNYIETSITNKDFDIKPGIYFHTGKSAVKEPDVIETIFTRLKPNEVKVHENHDVTIKYNGFRIYSTFEYIRDSKLLMKAENNSFFRKLDNEKWFLYISYLPHYVASEVEALEILDRRS